MNKLFRIDIIDVNKEGNGKPAYRIETYEPLEDLRKIKEELKYYIKNNKWSDEM